MRAIFRARGLACALTAALVLTGCAATGHTSQAAHYPMNPERVVAFGSAVDNLVSLGVTPVAVIEFPGDHLAQWREDMLEDVPRISADEVEESNPDLIVGGRSVHGEELYDALSDIAPTLTSGPAPDEKAWSEQLMQLGQIFDAEAAAADVIVKDHRRMEAARDSNSGLSGSTAVLARHWGGAFRVSLDDSHPAARFFSELGMKTPASMSVRAASVEDGRAVIRKERIGDLSVDFMVLDAGDRLDAVHAIPGYQNLPQVRSGAVVENGSAVAAALADQSAVSREWVLGQIADALENAASR